MRKSRCEGVAFVRIWKALLYPGLGFSLGMILGIGGSPWTRIRDADQGTLAHVNGKRLSEADLVPGEQIKLHEARLALYETQESIVNQHYLHERLQAHAREKGLSSPGEALESLVRSESPEKRDRASYVRRTIERAREDGSIQTLAKSS